MHSARLWLFRLVLSAFALALMLLLFEVGLRVLYAIDSTRGGSLQNRLLRTPPPEGIADKEVDFGLMVQASTFKDIVYEFKPHLVCKYRRRQVATNADGFRDHAYAVSKPPGTFRIVGLGDSVMFGWGVAADESYLAVLETNLNALPPPHPVYEVINTAVPGYNTAIEVATFEHKLLKFSPDLVIIQFVSNDFGVPSFLLRPPRALEWRKSYVREFISVRLGRLQRSFEDEQLVFRDFRNVEEEERANVIHEHGWMVGPDGYRAAMSRLGQLTRERGIPVIVMVGSLDDQQRAVVTGCAEQWGFHVLDISPVTKRVLARHGIPDTPEDWLRVGRLSRADSHPTPFAHTIYAEGLLERIQALGLAPAAPP